MGEFGNILTQAYQILDARISEAELRVKSLGREQEALRSEQQRTAGYDARGRALVDHRLAGVEADLEEAQIELNSYRNEARLIEHTVLGQLGQLGQQGQQGSLPRQSPAGSQLIEGLDCGLRLLLGLTCVWAAVEVVLAFGKPDFLNLLTLLSILSIFVLNYFDSVHVKVSLALAVCSLIMDLVWLILYTGSWFNPPAYSELNSRMAPYYQFCVVMTIALIVLKLPVIFILFQNREIDPSHSEHISLFGGKSLVIGKGEVSPIASALKSLVPKN